MLRLTEAGLFLVPFALYVAWLVLGRRTPRWAVWLAAGLTAAMAAGSIWYGLTTGLPAGSTYVPAQLEDGAIVPGHAARKPRW
jgi:hypothetical protein